MGTPDISFTDHSIAAKTPADYEVVWVGTAKALKSYQFSLFSYEVMHSSGALKSTEDLNERQAALRQTVEDKIAKGEALPRPVAGIGLHDNFEIGAGRDVFMALAVRGWHEIPVHIRKSQRKDLKSFILEKAGA